MKSCRQPAGAGHSFDNITVWIQGTKILFGGCLVKSMDSTEPGNLSDAAVPESDRTVKKVIQRCSEGKTVVPGHGYVGWPQWLTHSLRLVYYEKSNVLLRKSAVDNGNLSE